jgi:hypothetical protein
VKESLRSKDVAPIYTGKAVVRYVDRDGSRKIIEREIDCAELPGCMTRGATRSILKKKVPFELGKIGVTNFRLIKVDPLKASIA